MMSTTTLLLYVFCLLQFAIISTLFFRIAALHRRLADLNYLISHMIDEGVSDAALDLAHDYYIKKRGLEP